MKKSTIWILGVVMGLSFLSLLFLQVSYIEEMMMTRREQFDESVQRSLDQACRKMELAETRSYLEADAVATEAAAQRAKEAEEANEAHVSDEELVKYTERYSVRSEGGLGHFEWSMRIEPNVRKPIISSGKNIPQTARTLRDILNDRYVHQRALLDEVVFNILRTASDKPLKQRVNFRQLDAFLKEELHDNGITIPYHFTVTDRVGTMIYHCSDYIPDGNETLYSHVLFKNDPPQRMGMVNVHFPTMDSYIFSSVRFMIPSLIFTLVLLVTFIFTIYIIFRQKKLTEIKNDFINNMTHEFKTPISTISIAAQMLSDNKLQKSPDTYERLSGVIYGETKRLRYQVEKVLQMSLYDGGNIALKMQPLDANELIDSVVQTFNVKVVQNGGSLETNLDASNSMVKVDEMHFTNIIFNLMDNAVKYKRDDVSLELKVSTKSDSSNLHIQVEDNGIGIQKDDLKRVFDKFYRVHTGNTHNVKGFGLGLAYVHKMVRLHHGTIKVSSELGKGTKFMITLPLCKE